MDLTEEEFDEIDSYVSQKSLIKPAVSSRNLSSIYQCPDRQMYRARLQFLFHLDEYVSDQIQLDSFIDLVHGAILFSSNQSLTYPKTIVFLSIYLQIFKSALRNHFYQPEKLYEKCKKLILMHAVDRPPTGSPLFELEDVVQINEFFVQHFFKNLKLILNCFTPLIQLDFESIMPYQIDIPPILPLCNMEIDHDHVQKDYEPEPAQPQQPQHIEPPPVTELRPKTPQRATVKSPRSSSSPNSNDAKERSVPIPASASEASCFQAEVPVEGIRESLASMHEKFIRDFETKERQIAAKIKELEIKSAEKAATIKRPQTPRRK